jgi:hypothetical protein
MVQLMRRSVLFMIAVLAFLVVSARAAELLTLRNGSGVVCDHHARLGDRARVYLNAEENNYFEIQAQDIAGVEFVPDPPPPAAPPHAPLQSSTKTSAPGSGDVKLSQADLDQILANAGKRHNLDVDLLASVVKAESGGNARAVSRAGARGLMQLMPGTASDLGVQDSYKPDENVRGGSAYLDALLTHYHENLALALAAYNAGPAAVDKYHGIPPYHETESYVAGVIHEFNRRIRAREVQAKRTLASANPPLVH